MNTSKLYLDRGTWTNKHARRVSSPGALPYSTCHLEREWNSRLPAAAGRPSLAAHRPPGRDRRLFPRAVPDAAHAKSGDHGRVGAGAGGGADRRGPGLDVEWKAGSCSIGECTTYFMRCVTPLAQRQLDVHPSSIRIQRATDHSRQSAYLERLANHVQETRRLQFPHDPLQRVAGDSQRL